MTNEPEDDKVDFEKMYNDLKVKYDASIEKINSFDNEIKTRDAKITELKIYISDNLIGKSNDETKIDEPKSFDDIYKETLNEMRNKK